MDCSPLSSSAHGISQTRVLEWVAIFFLQRIFLSQESKPCLPHCQAYSLTLSHQGNPTYVFSSSSSIAQSCPTLCDPARPPCPSPTPGVHPNPCPLSQRCHPIISSSATPFSFCLQSPSIRVFSNESALCIRWPEYGSFSFSISPSNGYSQKRNTTLTT